MSVILSLFLIQNLQKNLKLDHVPLPVFIPLIYEMELEPLKQEGFQNGF